MVAKARRIVEDLGGQAMSPAEARAHLGLAETGANTRKSA